MSLRQDEMASPTGFGPRAVVWKLLTNINERTKCFSPGTIYIC